MDYRKSADTAAIFGAASSLRKACDKNAHTNSSLNLSDAYHGYDNLMREVMRIATQFETWTCQHINFDEFEGTWPYLLEEEFGDECLSILLPENLCDFDDHDCRRIASRFRLTLLKTD